MKKSSIIEVNGLVEEVFPGGAAQVKLSDGSCIRAGISAKIKVRFIGIRPGDLVRCEVSPYDPALARITGKL